MVPAWGTSDGPWVTIRDAWPGPTRTFWGAGLGTRAARGDWSLADDALDLAGVVDGNDVVCGAGWAAATVLLAAAQSPPQLIVLFSPPVGLELAEVVGAARADPNVGRDFMMAFGGDAEYWAAAQRQRNFDARVLAYLDQDVLGAARLVTSPVAVVGFTGDRTGLPQGWFVLSVPPEEVPANVLALMR